MYRHATYIAMLIASTWYWWTVLNLLLKSQFISLLSDMSLLSIEEDLSNKICLMMFLSDLRVEIKQDYHFIIVSLSQLYVTNLIRILVLINKLININYLTTA